MPKKTSRGQSEIQKEAAREVGAVKVGLTPSPVETEQGQRSNTIVVSKNGHCWHFCHRDLEDGYLVDHMICCWCGNRATLGFEQVRTLEPHGKYVQTIYDEIRVLHGDDQSCTKGKGAGK